jgi:HJR/Mrr/RecB family endonuclease
MASGLRHSNRRKYAKNTNDHVAFVLVILLAAAVYADRTKHLLREQSNLEFVGIAVALLGLTFLLFRKLGRHQARRRLTRFSPDNMSGVEFERYIASLLPSQGYNYIQLTEHYDLGLDILAEKEGVMWGIQVKRHSGSVKIAAVRQAVAALQHYGCDRAMVITNSSFSASAQDLALSNNCILVDGRQLMYWQTT